MTNAEIIEAREFPSTIETRKLTRQINISRAEARADHDDDRTVELSFSSEAPYERYFGTEILDHSPKSVRTDFLASGSAPLLLDHDRRNQIGVIESAVIGSDRVGRAIVRFSKNEQADSVLRDIRDGIRSNVSVGYRVHKMVLEESSDDGEIFRVNDWEPLEASIVAIPADRSVGVGRDDGSETFITQIVYPAISIRSSGQKGNSMTSQETMSASAGNTAGQEIERNRVMSITQIGTDNGMRGLADEHIGKGTSLDDFRALALERMGHVRSIGYPTAEIGLTDTEVNKFSFLRAINALSNPSNKAMQDAAAFEFDVSAATSEKIGQEGTGILIPLDVLSDRSTIPGQFQRDLTIGTATAGGHTKATDLLSGSFIDMQRNHMQIWQLGAYHLGGLVGDIAIPRQTGGASAYWVTEGVDVTESNQAFDQVTLAPKTVGTFTDLSRKLLLQSSLDIENFIRRDLAITLALEIDRVAINGSGSGAEPQGILNTSGIGDVSHGTNGGAPTWATMVELETDVATSNTDRNNMAYLTNSAVCGKLKTTEKASGTAKYIWEDGPEAPHFGMVNSHRAAISNQMPSNLTKGSGASLSSTIFGDWRDLIIGTWGALDLNVDKTTLGKSGGVRIIVLQDVDIALRHPGSFSASVDMITT